MAVLAVASGRVGKWEMGQGPHSGRQGRVVGWSGDVTAYRAVHGQAAPGDFKRAIQMF